MSKSPPIPGSCLCGRVRFAVTPPSRFVAHCHCPNCRRAHGAAFVTFLGVADAQFEILEGEDRIVRYRTDTDATRSFCGVCGTTFAYQGPRWPGEVHVAAACLDGPLDREPQINVYVDHKADWWEILDDLPRLGGPTGTEPVKTEPEEQ